MFSLEYEFHPIRSGSEEQMVIVELPSSDAGAKGSSVKGEKGSQVHTPKGLWGMIANILMKTGRSDQSSASQC